MQFLLLLKFKLNSKFKVKITHEHTIHFIFIAFVFQCTKRYIHLKQKYTTIYYNNNYITIVQATIITLKKIKVKLIKSDRWLKSSEFVL